MLIIADVESTIENRGQKKHKEKMTKWQDHRGLQLAMLHTGKELKQCSEKKRLRKR